MYALNYDVRYVHDFQDHVWAEVYIPDLSRWVHCDPSEGTLDSPLIYAEGWGKRPCIILATSAKYGIVDVTARYIPDYKQALIERKKKGLKGREIYDKIMTINAIYIQPDSINEWRDSQKKELTELAGYVLNPRKGDNCEGRISGSLEWRKSRGELGKETDDNVLDFSGTNLITGLDLSTLDEDDIGAFMILNGSCELLNNNKQYQFQLTPNKPDRVGSVFLTSPIDIQFGFKVSFRFNVSEGNGADGFAFVLQASGPEAIGEGGCGLGYSGIENCVALEFDTYKSADRCADPDSNHLSLHTGKYHPTLQQYSPISSHHSNSIACTTASSLPPFQSHLWYTATISYLNHNLQVTLTDSPGTLPTVILHHPNFNLPKYTNSYHELYLGFTASTGGLYQTHTIDGFKVEYIEEQS